MRKEPSPELTDVQKELIEQMLFGPYEDAWRDSKGQVDNNDKTIAKRLGIDNWQQVALYTDKLVRAHFKRVQKENNQDKS